MPTINADTFLQFAIHGNGPREAVVLSLCLDYSSFQMLLTMGVELPFFYSLVQRVVGQKKSFCSLLKCGGKHFISTCCSKRAYFLWVCGKWVSRPNHGKITVRGWTADGRRPNLYGPESNILKPRIPLRSHGFFCSVVPGLCTVASYSQMYGNLHHLTN